MKQRYEHTYVAKWEDVLRLEKEGWEIVTCCTLPTYVQGDVLWILKRPTESGTNPSHGCTEEAKHS